MIKITAGFRTTGIYPLNRMAVCTSAVGGASKRRKFLAERTGLQFIPLYSPSRGRYYTELSAQATAKRNGFAPKAV